MKNIEDFYVGAMRSEDPWSVDVFLINNGSKDVSIVYRQHAIQSDGDSIVDLGVSRDRTFVLPSYSASRIDQMTDPGELDFMTEYWLTVDGVEILTGIHGWSLSSDRRVSRLPLLHCPGYVLHKPKPSSVLITDETEEGRAYIF